MEQELAPHPYSAPTPIPVHAVYMHSGIYPEAKKKNKRQKEGRGSSLKKLNKLPLWACP